MKARTLVEIDEGVELNDDTDDYSNSENYQVKRNLNRYDLRQFYGPSSYMQVPRPIYGGMFGGGSINSFNQRPSNFWMNNNNKWPSSNQNNNNNNNINNNNNNNNNNFNPFNFGNNINNQPINSNPPVMTTTPTNNQFINPEPQVNNANTQSGVSSSSSCINAFRAKVFLNLYF